MIDARGALVQSAQGGLQLCQLLLGNQPDFSEHLHMRQGAEDVPRCQVGIEFAVLPDGEGFDLLVEGVGFLPEFHGAACLGAYARR